MAKRLKFSDNFWEEDICGTHGYDALVKRLKDGRQMCKDIEEYLQSRAKIEEEYSLKLVKLAKSAKGHCEIGTLKNAWEVLRVQTEITAGHHEEASKQFQDAVQRVAEFAEQQKNKRKPVEDNMKKTIKRKRELHKQTMDAKNTYNSKYEEAAGAEHALHMQKDQAYTKDLEKAKLKEQKTKQDSHKADQSYKDSLNLLEQIRLQWEKHMSHAAETFEKMEEERIAYLRNEMWISSNIVSQTNVDVDSACEEVRKTLETCDVDGDINLFIEKNRTGTKRPGKIEYEPVKPKV